MYKSSGHVRAVAKYDDASALLEFRLVVADSAVRTVSHLSQ
jgi:hypothetical protein